MRSVLIVSLLLWMVAAQADEATCTFRYNTTSRTITRFCTGGNVPMVTLTLDEQVALKSGRVQVCTITMEASGSAIREVRRECK